MLCIRYHHPFRNALSQRELTRAHCINALEVLARGEYDPRGISPRVALHLYKRTLAMARYFAVRCLLPFVLTACVLGSHFRGAIFMVRPNPGGGENEVSDSSPKFQLVFTLYNKNRSFTAYSTHRTQ